jgi:hypothetical protein
MPRLSEWQDPVCMPCVTKSALARVGAMEREIAVIQTDRSSSGSYRDACAAMQDDVAAALEDWPMGNGVVGHRY